MVEPFPALSAVSGFRFAAFGLGGSPEAAAGLSAAPSLVSTINKTTNLDLIEYIERISVYA